MSKEIRQLGLITIVTINPFILSIFDLPVISYQPLNQPEQPCISV